MPKSKTYEHLGDDGAMDSRRFIPKRVEFGLDTDMFDLVSNTHISVVFLPNVSQQTN